MRRTQIVFVLVILLLISGCTSNTDVIATINDKKVVKEQLNRQLVLAEISYHINGYDFPSSGETRKKLEKKLINKLVESHILVDVAKNEGIEIQEKEALAQRDSLIETIVSFYGGDEKYNEFLKEKDQKRDAFDEYLLGLAKENEYISKLYEKITENISVNSEEISNYYNEHIKYYNYSTKSIMDIEVEDENIARKIYNEIKKKNLSFEEALKEFKEKDSVNASDLGAVYYSSNKKEYSEIVFSTKIGEMSSVFESQGKYHIIYVYDENIQEPLPYEQVVVRVEEDLLKETKDHAYKNYVKDQMQNYDIRLN